jgi:hypothetical protein
MHCLCVKGRNGGIGHNFFKLLICRPQACRLLTMYYMAPLNPYEIQYEMVIISIEKLIDSVECIVNAIVV